MSDYDLYQYLLSKYQYNKTNGNLEKKNTGKILGHKNKYGYLVTTIKGKQYPLHRLIWLFINKKFPDGIIDHINGNRSDNRIENLRDVNYRINNENRKVIKANKLHSKFLGVGKCKGKYRARINVKGVAIHIGTFETEEEAYNAYISFKAKFHEGYLKKES